MAAIYGLAEPDGPIRYIGKANDPAARYAAHLRERRRRTPVYCWIESLRRRGELPRLVILVQESDDWKRDERGVIAWARAFGWPLLNLADGGDEPLCSPEVRAANGRIAASKRLKGIWRVKQMLGVDAKLGCESARRALVAIDETVAALRRLGRDDLLMELDERWQKRA